MPVSKQNTEPAAKLELHRWFPYRFSWIANEVSLRLHNAYHARWGISVPGWRIITVLAEYAPLASKDVAQETAMDVVQVTRAVNELFHKKLVLRREDQVDRRRVSLELSAAGRRLYQEVVPYARQLEDELLQGLSAAERATLAGLLDRVQANAGRLAPDDTLPAQAARPAPRRRSPRA
ncbi:MAG: MarR family winged helix-turn-helix transcriptional regulator [Ramlibacter sp.]